MLIRYQNIKIIKFILGLTVGDEIFLEKILDLLVLFFYRNKPAYTQKQECSTSFFLSLPYRCVFMDYTQYCFSIIPGSGSTLRSHSRKCSGDQIRFWRNTLNPDWWCSWPVLYYWFLSWPYFFSSSRVILKIDNTLKFSINIQGSVSLKTKIFVPCNLEMKIRNYFLLCC